MKKTPRGIRNHNPGNIRTSATVWQGQVGDDGAFVTFAAPKWGIRAMARVIINYQRKYGLNTIRKIIARWAPPNENDTDAYVRSVVAGSGYSADEPLEIIKALPRIIPPMIRVENGVQPYDDETILDGIALATSK